MKEKSFQNWLRVAVVLAVAMGSLAIADLSGQGGLLIQTNAPVYLALGDSYPYGSYCLNGVCGIPDDLAIEDIKTDNWFVGYPAYLQEIIDLPLVNAGCGGETTVSFLSMDTTEGALCRTAKGAGLLHVDYTGTQMDFAEAYLTTHNRTQLITLQISGNDAIRLFIGCRSDPVCINAGLPALIAKVTTNIDTILLRIRGTGYWGPLVFVEYPATNFTTFSASVTEQILQAIRLVVYAHGGEVAPVFERFRAATEPFGGDSCAAGILIRRANGVCNIHPTDVGHRLIASIIAEMLPPLPVN